LAVGCNRRRDCNREEGGRKSDGELREAMGRGELSSCCELQQGEDRVAKQATFETNRGTIVAELYEKDAPKTVENFEKLANSGFYDGVKFHRVIPDFVVQGGDPLSRDLKAGDPRIGTGGPGWKIKCETAGNPRKHEVGALSMAHAGKDTGGSQFFMVLSEDNTRHLNGVHTVFGKITEGIDVMKKITKDDTMTKVRVA
jgi:peptidyl-prolyl cis-trans isomerase B (cyclophilin B)